MKLSLSLRRKKKTEDGEPAEPTTEEVEKPTKVGPEKKSVTSGVKHWLFLHAEKIVCAATVLLLGWMIYSAIGKLRVEDDQTPDHLKDRVQQVRKTIAESKLDEARYPIPEFGDRVKQGYAKVAVDGYGFGSLAGAVKDPERRLDPDLFPAERPVATPGHGVFYVTQPSADLQGIVVEGGTPATHSLPRSFPLTSVVPPAGAKTEGRRWIAVNALAPYQKQLGEYNRCFAQALGYNPSRDFPRYSHILVQRLEYERGQRLNWDEGKSWELTAEFRNAEQARWATTASELADPKFVDTALTQPLGPLGSKSWKAWATHPSVPLAPPKPPRRRPGTGREGRTTPGLTPRVPAPPAARAPAPTTPGTPAPLPGGAGTGQGPGGGETTAPAPATGPPIMTEFKLVRFFDYTVEPGKNYTYRIGLVLLNPNSESTMVPARFLETPESREQPTRTTVWSRPSRPVRVPHDAQVYADRIEMGETEPVAHLVVRILEVAEGGEPAARLVLRRGSPVQQTAQTLELDVANQQIITNDKSNVVTEYTLIDFHGGAGSSAGAAAPSEMLFMDSRGNLVFRSAAADASTVAEFHQLETALTRPKKDEPKDGDGGGTGRNRLFPKKKNPLFDE